MSTDRGEILAFVAEIAGRDAILSDDTNIFETIGIDGDDATEFVAQFADRFGVDMAGYIWYFHHGEEGLNLGAFAFKPPYWRVSRIPITLAVLTEAVSTKRWPLSYPDHQLPARRWDLILNIPVTIAGLAIAALLASLLAG